MNKEIDFWKEKLHLEKHPEGGYYNENYRSEQGFIPDSINAKRDSAASIYFLLPGNSFSAFHRIKQDEIWYFHTGVTLNIHVLYPWGDYSLRRLGISNEDNVFPQIIVPAGCWFAAECSDKFGFSLVGCMTSPAFDFKDFQLASSNELLKEYPNYSELINRLSISS